MSESFHGTCVAPSGEFIHGIHQPQFTALNLRKNDHITTLGHGPEQIAINNADNFPESSVDITSASWVFEVPNAFPFMGATFIVKSDADRMMKNANPFNRRKGHSAEFVSKGQLGDMDEPAVRRMPRSLLLALAKTSTDPQLLANLARVSCRFMYDANAKAPTGVMYESTERGELRPAISDWHLFDVVSANQYLPDEYKEKMVLIPGAQGNSPIVGEYAQGETHVWEYLRENSYIPWGHYAANMAQDAIRYKIESLTEQDVVGLRHLYYQRMYVQLAAATGVPVPTKRQSLTTDELEGLRVSLLSKIEQLNRHGDNIPFNATIWGQNFGFDLSPSGYRLNASHQQIHQQFALVPSSVQASEGKESESIGATIGTYTQGDLVAQFVMEYRKETNQDFFETYLKAIRNNRRLDGRIDKESELIFYQDDNIMVFVPKAQRSQGEVQIVAKERCGNIIEADTKIRKSLDRAILVALKVLENLGAEMITALEISKRFDSQDCGQRLLYCFLPKHAQSPGSFSEFQQRWIINHYPEDFARVCRQEAGKILEGWQ